jgi:hypothetical protein
MFCGYFNIVNCVCLDAWAEGKAAMAGRMCRVGGGAGCFCLGSGHWVAGMDYPLII